MFRFGFHVPLLRETCARKLHWEKFANLTRLADQILVMTNALTREPPAAEHFHAAPMC